jgi:hypothetical protein
LRDVSAETRWTMLTTTTAESVAEALIKLAAAPEDVRRQRALDDSVRIRQRFAVESGVRSITEGLYREDKPAMQLQQQEWMPS